MAAAMITMVNTSFVAGWAAGYIYFYPPILFVIGLFAMIYGLATGNLAGGHEEPKADTTENRYATSQATLLNDTDHGKSTFTSQAEEERPAAEEPLSERERNY